MAETGSCRSCGKRVLWVVVESGKRMPLDAEPERRFVVSAAEKDPETGELRPMTARQRNTYVSHFSTCKDAECWRNK